MAVKRKGLVKGLDSLFPKKKNVETEKKYEGKIKKNSAEKKKRGEKKVRNKEGEPKKEKPRKKFDED